MASLNQNDTFYAGNSRVLQYTVVNADAAGSPALDLTAFGTDPADIKWTLVAVASNGSPVVDSPLVEKKRSLGTSSIQITSAATGVLQVKLAPADTANLAPRAYYSELELFDGVGGQVVVATGTITLLPNVVNT